MSNHSDATTEDELGALVEKVDPDDLEQAVEQGEVTEDRVSGTDA